VETILANTEGTKQLLELAKQQQSRLLFLSSGAVYGENSLQIDAMRETDFGSEDPLSPRACYSESKRLAETLCRAYFKQHGLDTRIARISHCYGPGMKMNDGRVFSDMLGDILNDRDIQLYSDGSDSRPFCYISDTVLGLFHILLKGVPGEAYNVGETCETSILELAHKMIAVARKKGRIEVRTKAQSPLSLAARSTGHFNIEKMINLDWKPRISLDEGLEKTFGFYK
jgi:dTDP-glucose 4,6-dehydratase